MLDFVDGMCSVPQHVKEKLHELSVLMGEDDSDGSEDGSDDVDSSSDSDESIDSEARLQSQSTCTLIFLLGTSMLHFNKQI